METTRAAAHLYRRVTRVVFESALMVDGSGLGTSTRAAAMATPGQEKTRSFVDDGNAFAPFVLDVDHSSLRTR